jgi:uncharacterized membrane protein
MEKSTELVIAVFEGEDRAADVLDELKKHEATKSIHWKNSAVITKDEEGKLAFKTPMTALAGTVFGAIVGGIVGLLLGGPVGGIVLGGVAGHFGLKNKVIDLEPDEENQQITELMTSSSSAIIAGIAGEQVEVLLTVLDEYGAQVVRQALDDDITQSLT